LSADDTLRLDTAVNAQSLAICLHAPSLFPVPSGACAPFLLQLAD
jgi:hypothetical protein